MTATIISSAITALCVLGLGILTLRQNTKGAAATTALDSRKVDLDEFDKVQARNESALDRADKAIVRAEERIAHLEEALVAEKSAREIAEGRAVSAERRAARLERRVDQLEQVLRDHDMPVPPAPAGSDLD